VKNHGLEKPTGTEIYLSRGQTYAQGDRNLYIALRSRAKPSTMISALRRELRDLDATLPLAQVHTMDEVMSAAQSRPRFLILLLTLFSGVALVLAAVASTASSLTPSRNARRNSACGWRWAHNAVMSSASCSDAECS
jgi:putative ABC transport system permease protein